MSQWTSMTDALIIEYFLSFPTKNPHTGCEPYDFGNSVVDGLDESRHIQKLSTVRVIYDILEGLRNGWSLYTATRTVVKK